MPDFVLADAESIDRLPSDEDADVCLFRQECLRKTAGRPSKKPVFQFVFRAYYRLDSAGLSLACERACFAPLEECLSKDDVEVG